MCPEPPAAVAFRPLQPWRGPPAAKSRRRRTADDDLRGRAAAFGLGSLTAEETLELFLRRTARGRAQEVARRLLRRFGLGRDRL